MVALIAFQWPEKHQRTPSVDSPWLLVFCVLYHYYYFMGLYSMSWTTGLLSLPCVIWTGPLVFFSFVCLGLSFSTLELNLLSLSTAIALQLVSGVNVNVGGLISGYLYIVHLVGLFSA